MGHPCSGATELAGAGNRVRKGRYVAQTDRQAKLITFFDATACPPSWLAFMAFVEVLWALIQLADIQPPADLVATTDNIVPYLIKTQLAVGQIGLVVAALIAAAISRPHSDLNGIATVIADNFYLLVRPHATDRQRIQVDCMAVPCLEFYPSFFCCPGMGTSTRQRNWPFNSAPSPRRGYWVCSRFAR